MQIMMYFLLWGYKFGKFFLSVAEKHCAMKKPQKARKKFQFFVYSPEHDRECEAVKVLCSPSPDMRIQILYLLWPVVWSYSETKEKLVDDRAMWL